MAAGREFRRGSHVLEYWLAHAEGFAVSAHASRLGVVERVRVERSDGHARELVVRTPILHRRRRVAAASFVAVDPAARRLELANVEPAAWARLLRRAASYASAYARRFRPVADRLFRAAVRRAGELARARGRPGSP